MKHQSIIGIVSLVLCLIPLTIHAFCREQSLAEAFRAAEMVLEAEVKTSKPHAMRGWHEVQLQPKKIWKQSKISADTILDFVASPERQPLVVGNAYLLFLQASPDRKLEIGKCSPRTHPLPVTEDEQLELQKLTAGRR